MAMKKFGKIILLISTISMFPISFLSFFSFYPVFNRIFNNLKFFIVRLLDPNINPYIVPSIEIFPFFNLHLPPLLGIGLLIIGTMLGWFLMAFYIVHLVKNRRIKGEDKMLWLIVLILGNIFGMIIYWFLHVWKERKAKIRTAPIFE